MAAKEGDYRMAHGEWSDQTKPIDEPELTRPSGPATDPNGIGARGETMEVRLTPVHWGEKPRVRFTPDERHMTQLLQNGDQDGAEGLATRLWQQRSE